MIQPILQPILHIDVVLIMDSSQTSESMCLLDLDLFHYLTLLTMTLPSLHVEGQASEN
jgi:hypothetical protein